MGQKYSIRYKLQHLWYILSTVGTPSIFKELHIWVKGLKYPNYADRSTPLDVRVRERVRQGMNMKEEDEMFNINKHPVVPVKCWRCKLNHTCTPIRRVLADQGRLKEYELFFEENLCKHNSYVFGVDQNKLVKQDLQV